MDGLPDVPFHFYIANMFEKDFSRAKHVIVASATIVLPGIVHPESHLPGPRGEAWLDKPAQADKWRVDTYGISSQKETESFRPLAMTKYRQCRQQCTFHTSEKRENQMDRREKLTEQNNREGKDSRNVALMYDDYIKNGPKVLPMLSKFQHMRDEHFGWITVTKHLIELISSDKRPIHSEPYKAGCRAWESRKHEINRMLAMNVIELAQSNLMFVANYVCT